VEDHITDRARSIFLLGAGILLTLGTSGCAKRPDVAIASAPAPTGAAATQQAPAPPPVATQPAPVQPAPMLPAPASSQPAPVQPTPPPAAAVVESAPPQVATAPAPRPAPAEFIPHDALQPIHFDFDKSDIRPGEGNTLQASARWLRENPGNLLLVEGHCDERGTTEYNAALGDPSRWQ
jgi:peptidoglycan-associated lipoprotein